MRRKKEERQHPPHCTLAVKQASTATSLKPPGCCTPAPAPATAFYALLCVSGRCLACLHGSNFWRGQRYMEGDRVEGALVPLILCPSQHKLNTCAFVSGLSPRRGASGRRKEDGWGGGIC